MILGIDFGTTNSMIAIAKGKKKPEVESYNLFSNSFLYTYDGIPSLVAIGPNDELYYGFDALRIRDEEINKIDSEYDIISSLKTKIRNATDFKSAAVNDAKVVNAFSYSYKELLEGFLKYLIDIATGKIEIPGFPINPKLLKEVGSNIEEVTITAPVGNPVTEFNGGSDGRSMSSTTYKEYLLGILTKVTGLPSEKVHVLEEPCAAAIAARHSKDYDFLNKDIAIFDLGGGTLDVTVLKLNDKNQPVYTCKEGDSNLGGDKWDEALAKFAIAGTGVDLLMGVKIKAQKCKKQLTNQSNTQFMYQPAKRSLNPIYKVISRNEFYNASKDLLDRALKVLKKALKDGNSVDCIILTGGSSNMPQVQEAIRNMYPDKEVILYNASTAIAEGAAIDAFYRNKQDDSTFDEKVVPINTITHSYGINTYVDKAHPNMIGNIFYRGQEIKLGEEKSFYSIRYPVDDSQVKVTFIVYENNSDNEHVPLE